MILQIFFTLLLTLEVTFASRILFLFPTPGKSHMIVAHALSTTLAERGHDVTVLSAFKYDKKIPNHREILVPFDVEFLQDFSKGVFENPNQSFLKTLPWILKKTTDLGKEAIKVPEFQRILKEEKFDLVIIGMFFNNFLLGYGDHFKCPTAMLSTAGSSILTNSITGNPAEIHVVPSMHLNPSDPTKLTFIERVKNFLMSGAESIMFAYIDYQMKIIYDEIFQSNKYRSYEESIKNLSLALVNGHFSQGGVRPNVPAVIEVGGLQVKPKPNPLPEKLQSWLDDSSHGVIFFSLGSNTKVSFLPPEKIKIFLNVFEKLKQRVIMKWESDVLEGKPDNVMVGKWLPQDDILAHPNLKAFISHCGLGGVSESRFHGVPIIALPLFADQEKNANDIVTEGWALQLNIKTLTEKNLLTALNEILTNETYSNTIKRISNVYRDRAMSARETAVYWVEYILRHHGAPHLQYPAVNLNFIQRNSLDVIGLLIAIIYIVLKTFTFIIRKIYQMIFKRSEKKKDEKTITKKKN